MMYSSQSERKVDITFIDKLYAALNIASVLTIRAPLVHLRPECIIGKISFKGEAFREEGTDGLACF